MCSLYGYFMGFLLDKAPLRLKDDVKQALEEAGRNDKALMNRRRLQEVKIFTPPQN